MSPKHCRTDRSSTRLHRTPRSSGRSPSAEETKTRIGTIAPRICCHINSDMLAIGVMRMRRDEIGGSCWDKSHTPYFGFLVNFGSRFRSKMRMFAENIQNRRCFLSRTAGCSVPTLPLRGSRIRWRGGAVSSLSLISLIGNSEIRNPLVRKGSSFPINGLIGNARDLSNLFFLTRRNKGISIARRSHGSERVTAQRRCASLPWRTGRIQIDFGCSMRDRDRPPSVNASDSVATHRQRSRIAVAKSRDPANAIDMKDSR